MRKYAEKINQALLDYTQKLGTEEGFETHIKVKNKRFQKPGLPSSSALGRCPRRREYERRGAPVTHPQDEQSLNILFSQGKIIGQMVVEAIRAAPDFYMVVSEVNETTYQNEDSTIGYTSSIDIGALISSKGDAIADHRILIEVKNTDDLSLKPHYIYQIVSYMEAFKKYSVTTYGYIVTINRFGWRVYSIGLDHYGNVISMQYLPDGLYAEQKWFHFEDFWKEVKLHNSFSTREDWESFDDFVVYPLMVVDHGDDKKVSATHWECLRINEQPHVYKAASKDGKYQKGDEKLGKGTISCPFAGHCFPWLAGQATFGIHRDDNVAIITEIVLED